MKEITYGEYERIVRAGLELLHALEAPPTTNAVDPHAETTPARPRAPQSPPDLA